MSDVFPKYLDGFLAAVDAVTGKANGTAPLPAAEVPDRPSKPPPPDRPGAVWSEEERIKKKLHPLDAFARLLHCANTDQPPCADDRFRFRWFGLFYQHPEQDAFLLRLRLPGGRLRADQLTGLAGIAQELAGGFLTCNPQGGLDLPGVPLRVAAEVLRRAEEIGLRTLLAGGDCVQAVRGGELDGTSDDPGPPSVYPLVRELEQALAHDRQLADLPGSCEVILRTANEHPAILPEGPPGHGTILFQGIHDAGVERTFSLSVPRTDALELKLRAAQIVPACLGLLRQWAEGGDRSDRGRTGLAKFCAETGRARLRESLAQAAGPLIETPSETPVPPAARPRPFAGVRVQNGRLLSETLTRLAGAARDLGAGEVRLAAGRLYLPHAPNHPEAEKALRDALDYP